MKPIPGPDEVLDGLGSKVTSALVAAVDLARQDLEDFREWRPSWFPSFTGRFLANFVHERLWAYTVARLDGVAEVNVVDNEPFREIHVGNRYAIRIKKHSIDDQISTYPTRGAMDFWSGAETLPGLESANLALGYLWDPELCTLTVPVLSYRDDLRHPVWAVKLVEGDAGATSITWDPIDPSIPEFDLSQVIEEDEPDTEDGR